jgi:RNA-directed DNA polymerase
MEEVCERENLLEALRRVKANKGSAGIDGMTVGQLSGYLKEHWEYAGANPAARIRYPRSKATT